MDSYSLPVEGGHVKRAKPFGQVGRQELEHDAGLENRRGISQTKWHDQISKCPNEVLINGKHCSQGDGQCSDIIW